MAPYIFPMPAAHALPCIATALACACESEPTAWPEDDITLIDYECLEHDDGQRIIGFGFFAGIVGAHNGMMAYGNRSGLYKLDRVYKQRNFRELIHAYFGVRLPNVKIVVTMNLMNVI